MKPGWTKVALGEVLDARTKSCAILPEQEYKEVTVRLWGRGVRLRRKVHGAEINATKRNVATTGDFILSKIDARHGAYGFIPSMLDGAVVTNDFPLFQVIEHKLNPRWLYWISKSRFFVNLCKGASKGTTNRVRLKESLFFELEIPLPPLTEQNRLTTHLDAIEQRLHQIQKLRENQNSEVLATLRSTFQNHLSDAKWFEMYKIAPLVKREVNIDLDQVYTEYGVRSFYKGIFLRRKMEGSSYSWQKLFRLNEGDVVFSNIMSWEKAIGLATKENAGWVGNHRMLVCEPLRDMVIPCWLYYFFTTKLGFDEIERASPGTAARNKTLKADSLEKINVPIPSIEQQIQFERLFNKINTINSHHKKYAHDYESLTKSLLDHIF